MHTVLPDCVACYPTVFAVNNEYQVSNDANWLHDLRKSFQNQRIL